MNWPIYVAEAIFFLLALPLFAFQSIEFIHALVDFLANFNQYTD